MSASHQASGETTTLLMTVLLDPSAEGLSPEYITRRRDGIVGCVSTLLATAKYAGKLSGKVNKSQLQWCVELHVEDSLVKQLDLFVEQPRIFSAETARNDVVNHALLALQHFRRATGGVPVASIEQVVLTLPKGVQDVLAAFKSLPDNTLPIKTNWGDFQLGLQTSNGRELDNQEHSLFGCIVAAGPLELAFRPLRKRSATSLCTQPVRVLIPCDIRSRLNPHAVLDEYVMTNRRVQLTVLSEKATGSRRQQTKLLVAWPPMT